MLGLLRLSLNGVPVLVRVMSERFFYVIGNSRLIRNGIKICQKPYFSHFQIPKYCNTGAVLYHNIALHKDIKRVSHIP